VFLFRMLLLAAGLVLAPGVSRAADASEFATPILIRTRTWAAFGLDRIHALQADFLGYPVWGYLASLVFVLLAFYGSKLLDYLIQVQLRKWAQKTATRLDDLLVDLLRGPVKIVSFVILLHLGMRVYAWPSWAAEFISAGLKLTVAGSLTYLAIKVVDLLMGLWQQRALATQEGVLDLHLLPVIRKTLKIFVVVVAVLVTCQNLGMHVTGLLASVSIGGLAVGLAAQDTLSNLFGAVAIFADKPFRVGDRIQLDSIDGTVETIGLRSTRVRNQDGFLVTIPNRTVANASIVNVSKRPNIKTVINIGVTYDTPARQIERAMEILEETYRPHPMTADLLVCLNKFDASTFNIQVIHWWNATDFREYALGIQKLHLAVKRRFDEAGISLASPNQTVYLRQDPGWRLVEDDKSRDLQPPTASVKREA
jgi:MscS family membrane protein